MLPILHGCWLFPTYGPLSPDPPRRQTSFQAGFIFFKHGDVNVRTRHIDLSFIRFNCFYCASNVIRSTSVSHLHMPCTNPKCCLIEDIECQTIYFLAAIYDNFSSDDLSHLYSYWKLADLGAQSTRSHCLVCSSQVILLKQVFASLAKTVQKGLCSWRWACGTLVRMRFPWSFVAWSGPMKWSMAIARTSLCVQTWPN